MYKERYSVPLKSRDDLKALEIYLRNLYNVEENIPCVALNSASYIMFKIVCLQTIKCDCLLTTHTSFLDNRVKLHLHNRTAVVCVSDLSAFDASSNNDIDEIAGTSKGTKRKLNEEI